MAYFLLGVLAFVFCSGKQMRPDIMSDGFFLPL